MLALLVLVLALLVLVLALQQQYGFAPSQQARQ